MDIDTIRMMVQNGLYRISKHCRQRMKDRNINVEMIEKAIATGRICDERPRRKPHPTCVVEGYIEDAMRNLYVVCGVGKNVVYITVDWNVPRSWG